MAVISPLSLLRRGKRKAHQVVQALTSLSLLLWTFSVAYYCTGHRSNYGQSLSKAEAFYFAVTVLSTTGFGDISPLTDGTRLLVSLQMLLGLVFFAVVVASLVSAISEGGGERKAPP